MQRPFLVLLFLLVMTPQWGWSQPAPERPRNIIMMIADGAGPASFTMARDYLRSQRGEQELPLDSVLVGSVRTYSTDHYVTDSAAGATAYSAGVKTYNGAIAVNVEKEPVATLLEAAEESGMATGLVATSRITHATPASYAAHVPDRWQENEIASQMMEQGIDVIFGGGRRHFLPASAGGRREDGRNLIADAQASGYEVLKSKQALGAALETPVLGLFSPSHMSYEIDRVEEPSLTAMTKTALDLLSEEPEGFFLMVEGSRIDHAGHGNDPAAHLHDVLSYLDAVQAALRFARREGETLVVSVSDHETGGLSLGRDGVYDWRPDTLARVGASLEVMVDQVISGEAAPEQVLREHAGIERLTDAEQKRIEEAGRKAGQLKPVLSDLTSRRSLLGWTTTGHTGVDVNLYAWGPGAARFRGHHDNTYVGRMLADLMNVNLEGMTQVVRQHDAGKQQR